MTFFNVFKYIFVASQTIALIIGVLLLSRADQRPMKSQDRVTMVVKGCQP